MIPSTVHHRLSAKCYARHFAIAPHLSLSNHLSRSHDEVLRSGEARQNVPAPHIQQNTSHPSKRGRKGENNAPDPFPLANRRLL